MQLIPGSLRSGAGGGGRAQASAVTGAFAAGRVTLPFAAAFGVLAGSTLLAFAPSYYDLAPLAGSDSPESIVLLVPLLAFVLLYRALARAPRNGDQLSVNLVFAAPLLLVLAALLLWLPARLSFAYWVYRLDLLAVPLFVASGILLVFGLPALWRAKWAVLVLLLGWPPVVDRVVSTFADPLASAQSWAVGAVVHPFASGVSRTGTEFVFSEHGRTIGALQIASACSGLAGLLTMAVVAGGVAAVLRGRVPRRLAWLAVALALALLANLVRLVALVVLADRSGFDIALTVFHESVGAVLFALFLAIVLLLVRPFGLSFPVVRPERGEPVALPARTAAGVAAALFATTLGVAWATSGFAYDEPGLFRGVPVIVSAERPLPAPPGYRVARIDALPSVQATFGAGAVAKAVHLVSSGPQGVGAQVVVTPSYWDARRYGVLQCFAFHHYSVLSTHRAALPGGGTATLVALHADGRDISSVSWLQPVLVGGRRAWRRVVLFRYLGGEGAAAPPARPSGGRSLGLWLLDALSPYGAGSPPPRFVRAERELESLAAELAAPRA